MQDFSLPEQRRQHILELLATHGKVIATELSVALGVSEDTVRRDLKELDNAGLLCRVHGGALPSTIVAQSYSQRRLMPTESRQSLVAAVTPLLKDGQMVFMDSGTTLELLARHLPQDRRLTVVTASPPVMMALQDHTQIEVIMLGGKLNKTTMSAVGGEVLEALGKIRFDLCLLGVCGIHPQLGVMASDYDEAQVKRLAITQAKEVVALGTADKLEATAPFKIADVEALAYLLTDAQATDQMLERYRLAGVNVVRGEA